jgi:methyltransferase (TIGR00027 family)
VSNAAVEETSMMCDESRSAEQSTLGISKTAIWVAAARAVGAREPYARVRNPDRLAERLLGDPSKLELDHPIVDALSLEYHDAMQDIEVADTVRAMTERTRFIDDALERAIAGGAVQVLIPGAGFDSHAYRCRDMLKSVEVFEVDRLATLAFKQRRVDEALGGPPENLTYVAVDFQCEQMSDVLPRHGYDTSRRTFVIMEGLTMYLPEESLSAVFRFVASHPPGSGVVFDFATHGIVESIKQVDLASVPPAAKPPLERLLDLIRDEPWLFGFAVDGEREFLAELGLELGELLTIGSDESVERYLTRADGTTVGAEAHAKAQALREAAQTRAMQQMGAEGLENLRERMREQQRQMAYRIAEAFVP